MPRRLPLLVLALLVAAVPACRRGGGGGPVLAPAPVLAPLPEDALVYYDNSGGIQDSIRTVVRDAEGFDEVWRRATSTQESPPARPAIDFSREMVLVVGAGQMTPEDLIRVDSVGVREESVPGTERTRFLEAVVRTVEGCLGFRAEAYPLAIVRVRRFDGEVRFTERRGVAEGCGVPGEGG